MHDVNGAPMTGTETVEGRIAALESDMEEIKSMIAKVGEAMEKAKTNPMMKPLMRMLGVE